MSEEALQIAEERREVKGKGERERYIQLNAVGYITQRIARRGKNFHSYMNNAKKYKKAIEGERREISSRKVEI